MSIENNKRLIFESRPTCATVKTGLPAKFRFGEFDVFEALRSKRPDGQNESSGSDQYYVVRFTAKVDTEEGINKAFSDFRTVKSEIDAVWQFVFGFAYDSEVRTDTTSPAIPGWADNSQAILASLPRPNPSVHLETESFPVLQFADWPLKRILRAITYYREADETHKFLMNLHATSISTENVDIRLTLLGKLADLCETLLPGETRQEKILSIPSPIRDRLVFDSEIFRIANTRSLTRHAAKKGDKQLHPGMSPGEIEDFQSDIDTLVRYLVSGGLKFRPGFYEGWRFPPNCAVRWSGQIGKERSRTRDEKRRNAPE